jgi:hypothetical protein
MVPLNLNKIRHRVMARSSHEKMAVDAKMMKKECGGTA